MENQQQPVVAPVKINAPKASQGFITAFNGVSLAIASLFSVISVFAAIASFTNGKWSFGIPVVGQFNITGAPTLLVAAVAALAFALVSFLTVRKITDAEKLKSVYSAWATVYAVLSIILVSAAIAVVFYGLFTVGDKSVSQKNLWLSGFLPGLVVAGASVAITFMYKAVAGGKTAILSMINLVVVCAAALGLLLTVISVFVDHYGDKKSYNNYNYSDYLDDAEEILDKYMK
jgi:MFS family permease